MKYKFEEYFNSDWIGLFYFLWFECNKLYIIEYIIYFCVLGMINMRKLYLSTHTDKLLKSCVRDQFICYIAYS